MNSANNNAMWISIGVALFVVFLATNQFDRSESKGEPNPVWVRIHWDGDQDKPPPSVLVSMAPVDLPVIFLERRVVLAEGDFHRVVAAGRDAGCTRSTTTFTAWSALEVITLDDGRQKTTCRLPRVKACEYLTAVVDLAQERNLGELFTPTEYLHRFLMCEAR